MKSNERRKNQRASKRTSGLRLLRIWVPDTRSPVFAAECRRQAELIRGDPAETDALALIGLTAAWKDDAAL